MGLWISISQRNSLLDAIGLPESVVALPKWSQISVDVFSPIAGRGEGAPLRFLWGHIAIGVQGYPDSKASVNVGVMEPEDLHTNSQSYVLMMTNSKPPSIEELIDG